MPKNAFSDGAPPWAISHGWCPPCPGRGGSWDSFRFKESVSKFFHCTKQQ